MELTNIPMFPMFPMIFMFTRVSSKNKPQQIHKNIKEQIALPFHQDRARSTWSGPRSRGKMSAPALCLYSLIDEIKHLPACRCMTSDEVSPSSKTYWAEPSGCFNLASICFPVLQQVLNLMI